MILLKNFLMLRRAQHERKFVNDEVKFPFGLSLVEGERGFQENHPPNQEPKTGSGTPKPFKNTRTQNTVSPAASAIDGSHRK